jgi:hypothetical protein
MIRGVFCIARTSLLTSCDERSETAEGLLYMYLAICIVIDLGIDFFISKYVVVLDCLNAR